MDRDALRFAAVGFAAAVGLSRVYLRKHNASDVTSGLLFGTGTAALLEAGVRAAI